MKESTSRDQLRAFLQEHLDRQEAADPSEEAVRLCRVLHEALGGLGDLDHGEAPPIFAPTRAKYQRASPARVRQLEMRAVLHQKALERLGTAVAEARKEIADRFGMSAEAVRKWREKHKKAPDYLNALQWAECYHETCKRMGWPVRTKEQIFAAAKRDGKALFRAKKKQ